MKRLAISAAFAVLALGASAVHADEFDFSLTGSGLAEITDAPGCTRYGCDPFVSAVWDGSVRVKLDGAGDGVYSADRIESFAVESNWQSYTWLNGDPGLYGDNSVTVENGAVTDLEFNWSIDASHSEYFQVSTYPPGSSFISAVANGYCSGCGRFDAIGYHFPFGTLIAIPEPANAGLLLAGLCLLATRIRRRGSRRWSALRGRPGARRIGECGTSALQRKPFQPASSGPASNASSTVRRATPVHPLAALATRCPIRPV